MVGVQKVRETLSSLGVEPEITEFESETKTSQQAAQVMGCELGQIAKSLVLEAGTEVVLVVASGANRVDKGKIARLVGRKVKMMEAGKVMQATGFEVGSVPPVGHKNKLRTLVDKDLMAYDYVYPAAGSSNSVFRIEPRELVRITKGEVCDVRLEQ